MSAGLTAMLVGAVLARSVAQEPQPAPTFRSAVDLVRVDASVIGEDGRPVTGLAAGDFTITVDGRARRVSSAEYIEAVREGKPPVPSGPVAYSSNVSSGGGGRLIMFVVDRASIGPGRGRQALDAASRFISRLVPADRVGLIGLPGGGPNLDFTANHALVQAELPKLTGVGETVHTLYRIGVSEAVAIGQGDRMALNTLTQRECSDLRTPQEVDACLRQVVTDANSIYSLVNERSQNALSVLRALIERLAATPTPKTIVFLSEGMIVDRLGDVSWLGPASARAQVTIYAMHLDVFASDASVSREPATPGRDKAIAVEGLGVIAGATRGRVLPVVTSGDNAFARLALELSGYYLLTFEPEATDRDGKPHKIRVALQGRPGVDIRARSEFTVDAARTVSDEAALVETLRAPALASEIGLKLSAYTLRDPASSKLRVLMAAEIDRSLNPESRIALAFTLVDDKGNVVGTQIDREVKAPVNPDTRIQKYTGFIVSESTGAHTLKLAVIDDRGKRGSVEHSFRAVLTPVGELKATDLLIADERTGSGGASPVVGGEFTSGMVNSYIELYADAAEALKNATVIFEVAVNDQSRALDGAAGRVQPASAEHPNRRIIEGSVPLALLPPGDYFVRAIVSADGRRLGQISRPFRVGRMATPAKPAPTASLRPIAARSAPVSVASRVDRFDRGSVLTPQVVGFFMERLNLGERGETNPAPIVEHARAGRFDEATKSLSAGSTTLQAVFLAGLALYAKGELDPAAAKFRETLRLDSEFFPAAFYLGSCYAAGGRDEQAVGAWQLSLVTQSDAPFIYTLLGDALLRMGDTKQALEVLNEAEAQWPDNEEVQVRIGAAFAMSGKRADALLKFEPYLEKHPDDHDRHFLALRTLYQARSEGKPIRSREEDRALFTKWAAAYAAAKGPQQALVDQWQKAMTR
jgi:VWFA-related protein